MAPTSTASCCPVMTPLSAQTAATNATPMGLTATISQGNGGDLTVGRTPLHSKGSHHTRLLRGGQGGVATNGARRPAHGQRSQVMQAGTPRRSQLIQTTTAPCLRQCGAGRILCAMGPSRHHASPFLGQLYYCSLSGQPQAPNGEGGVYSQG